VDEDGDIAHTFLVEQPSCVQGARNGAASTCGSAGREDRRHGNKHGSLRTERPLQASNACHHESPLANTATGILVEVQVWLPLLPRLYISSDICGRVVQWTHFLLMQLLNALAGLTSSTWKMDHHRLSRRLCHGSQQVEKVEDVVATSKSPLQGLMPSMQQKVTVI
jgi:hypothetical protein